jgi:hypothetical protein
MEPQTFEARAPRGKLEQLSRCGSDLNGESAVELVGDLAIGNPEEIGKVWATIALLSSTHNPTSAETIKRFADSVMSDVCDRVKPLIMRKLKGRYWIIRKIIEVELGLMALCRNHMNIVDQRAVIAKMRRMDYSMLESDVVAIIHDRLENSAANIRREQWT